MISLLPFDIGKVRTVFVLGNGRSRLGLNLDRLKNYGLVIGCNAIYRDWMPDMLVSVDPKMTEEIREAGVVCPHVYAQRGSGPSKPLCSTFGWEYRDMGLGSGPTAGEVACRLGENLREVYLVGVDLGSWDGWINNVYAGTPLYQDAGHRGFLDDGQIGEWETLMARYPRVMWYWRAPYPSVAIPRRWQNLTNLVRVDKLPFEGVES